MISWLKKKLGIGSPSLQIRDGARVTLEVGGREIPLSSYNYMTDDLEVAQELYEVYASATGGQRWEISGLRWHELDETERSAWRAVEREAMFIYGISYNSEAA